MRPAPLYRYVGPPAIAAASRGVEPGRAVRARSDLVALVRTHASVLTFVVERARVTRGRVDAFAVDVFVEPGSHDEDRVAVRLREGGVDFVLADGAGNSGRRRGAAERAVALVSEPGDPVDRLAQLDVALAHDGSEAAVAIGAVDVGDARAASRADAILCASDGLAAWAGPELDDAILAHDDAVFRLADAVRMRSGRLADDLSIVLVRRSRPST